MLLIIAHHYVVNSGLNIMAYGDIFSWRSQFLLNLGAYGKTGINCFVFLSSYFLCGRDFEWKRILRLFAQWKFYEFLLFAVFLFYKGYETMNLKRIFELVMPFTALESNFMPCFLIFCLLMPFLNTLVANLTSSWHLQLLLLLLLVYTIMGSVPTVHITFNYVSCFCVLFLLASYIRKYPARWMESGTTCVWLLAFSLVASAGSILLGSWLTIRMHQIVVFSLLKDSHKVLAVTNAVTSFLVFRNINLGYCPVINWVASSVFGIFLVHTSSGAIRHFIWQDLAHCQAWFSSPYLPLHAFVTVICVFIAGLIIDKARALFVSCLLCILKKNEIQG